MNFQIGLISGDGIGPEIVAEAKKVLDQVCSLYGHHFSYTCLLYTSGMVHPLIIHPQRPLQGSQVGDGILSEDGDSVRVDQLRNAVVDLRICLLYTSPLLLYFDKNCDKLKK